MGVKLNGFLMDKSLQQFDGIAPATDGGFYYYSISAPCSNNFEPGHLLVTRFDKNGGKVGEFDSAGWVYSEYFYRVAGCWQYLFGPYARR